MPALKILLVDDAHFFLEVARGFFRQSAATVFTAANGREALQVAQKVRPDLIYMDLHMPDMNGAACCAALKADPALRSVPVIMVTTPGEGDMELCREAGCDAILTKPVDRNTFLTTGRAFLAAIERRERRIPCRATVVCRLNSTTWYGTIEDLSEGGMFVGSRCDARAGDRITMSFFLPGNGAVIETEARLIWVNGGAHRRNPELPEGFGVEFLEMADESLEIVREFVEHCTLRHLPLDEELLRVGR